MEKRDFGILRLEGFYGLGLYVFKVQILDCRICICNSCGVTFGIAYRHYMGPQRFLYRMLGYRCVRSQVDF